MTVFKLTINCHQLTTSHTFTDTTTSTMAGKIKKGMITLNHPVDSMLEVKLDGKRVLALVDQ